MQLEEQPSIANAIFDTAKTLQKESKELTNHRLAA
jgi:hypothetical protein